MESENPDLARAILRAERHIDLGMVDELVDQVPAEAYGRMLMTPEQRVSHKRLLHKRYEEGIVPAADRVRRLGLA
jgi:hypothetical protein